MKTFDRNGLDIVYEDVGAGRDVVLFIHGHPFDRSMWSEQLDSVAAAGWRAIAPDLRGYGETGVTAADTTLDIFANDIIALLDDLGVGRAVFVGLSMGGQIAMEVARLHRTRVRGLVLAATFPRAETETGRRVRYETAAHLLDEGMEAYAAELLPKMLSARTISTSPDAAARVLQMMRRSPPQGAAAALRGRAQRPPYQPVLAGLDAPALIVVGDQDAFTTRHDAEEMRALLRRSTLLWLDDTGHMPNLEQPEAFNAALTGFLQSLLANDKKADEKRRLGQAPT